MTTVQPELGASTGLGSKASARPKRRVLSQAQTREQIGERLIAMAARSEIEPQRVADELLELSPEEVDIDALRDPDDPDDPDDLSVTFRSRRAADIVFERSARRRAPRLPVGTRVRARNTDQQVTLRVRPTDPTRVLEASDALDADLYEARLEALGEVLLDRQRSAVLAPSLAQAFFALSPLTQADHAAATGLVDAPWLSKRNGLLVACPWGIIPIEFFWWRRPDMSEVVLRAVHQLARILPLEPQLGPLPAARRALAEIGAEPDAGHADSIRQLVPAVHAVIRHSDLIQTQRASLPDVDDVNVVKMIAVAEPDLNSSRLLTVVRMAIVGAFEEEWV